MLCVASDPIKIHSSERTKENFREKLKSFKEKQQKNCLNKCVFYYNTSYHARHPIKLIEAIKRVSR